MRSLVKFISIFVTCAILSFNLRAAEYRSDLKFSESSKMVDFFLYYPIVKLDDPGISVRNRAAAGLGFSYNYFLTSHFGIQWTGGSWFLALKVDGRKRPIWSVYGSSGPAFRFFPGSYLDPQINGIFGIATTRVGGRIAPQTNFPMGARFFFSAFRSTDRYSDTALSLIVFSDGMYYLNPSAAMKPFLLTAGLGLRGSF